MDQGGSKCSPVPKFLGSREKIICFRTFPHGGSRDALVHLLPMEPSAKEFQDSDRGEPPNGVRTFVDIAGLIRVVKCDFAWWMF